MKTHTTNYHQTFIEIAEDCAVQSGEMPPLKGDKKTIANMQFELLYENPYKYTSDEVLFAVFAQRNDMPKSEFEAEWQTFFSKGQPCFRASPLTKTYGWGVHSDADGKIAIFGAESAEYQEFVADDSVQKVKAMRSKKAK